MDKLEDLRAGHKKKIDQLSLEFSYEEELLMTKHDIKKCPKCNNYIHMNDTHLIISPRSIYYACTDTS